MLAAIVAAPDLDPETRVREWLAALFAAKRRKAFDDPELFATYTVLTTETAETVVGEHIAELTGQLTELVRAGVAAGAFTAEDPAATAGALFRATDRFHDPHYAREWEQPGVERDFEALTDLLLRGLRARG